MTDALDFDLKQIVLFNGSFGPSQIEELEKAVSSDYSKFSELRDAVDELRTKEEHSPASNVRLGVCLFLLGQYDESIETLRHGDGGAVAQFYLGKAYCSKDDFTAAIDAFASAEKGGYDYGRCALAKVEVQRLSGESDAAMATLDSLSGAIEQTADYLAQRGATVAAVGGNPSEVVALYERAVDSDSANPAALFGLALENDRRGNDDVAIELYRRSAERFPSYVGALLNLGLLYEDRGQNMQAVRCYNRVLSEYPLNKRAQLFIRDTEASSDQYYDEDAQRKRDRVDQLLDIQVTDFELSVRSRNCLRRMGVKTLGDLCSNTEQELLASKNFGETSLSEIRDMLANKGLRLGQFAHERQLPEPFDVSELSDAEQQLLSQPVADLNLSVRARKCMVRIGVSTIGDLVRRTGDDLLECKNFGVTSLNEVREKLTIQNLKLRGE